MAKPNRVTAFDAPMRCPACSYEWLYSVNLERAKLSEAIENLVCPQCGAEPARIRTDWLPGGNPDRLDRSVPRPRSTRKSKQVPSS